MGGEFVTVMSINTQPSESVSYDAEFLDVQDIYPTLQRYGPFAGRRAVIVSLAGCTRQCPRCTTDYTSKRRMLRHAHVLLRIEEAFESAKRAKPLVVLTGGEPMRQNLVPLIAPLLSCGYDIQIETGGELRPTPNLTPFLGTKGVTVVCSPKSSVHVEMKRFVHHLVYVGAAGHLNPDDGLPETVLGADYHVERPWAGFRGTVYLRPEDSGDIDEDGRNVAACIESCMKFGYVYCEPIDKLVGMSHE